MVAEGWKSKKPLARLPARDPRDERQGQVAAVAQPGSTAPIKPNQVKTVIVRPATMRTASLTPLPLDANKLMPAATPKLTTVKTVRRTKLPPDLPDQAPARASAKTPAHVSGGLPEEKVASVTTDVPLPPAARAKGGYMIQVGAFDDERRPSTAW